jgi:Tol biopolymer transport system component
VVVALDPNRLVATALTHEGSVRSPTVSLDGTRVAFELRGEMYDPTAPDDTEIASVPTAGGSLAVLTRNALKDSEPRITPDGAHVVWKTRVEIPRTDWVVTASRHVALTGR